MWEHVVVVTLSEGDALHGPVMDSACWGRWWDVAVTLSERYTLSEGYALYSPVMDASCGDGGGL